MDDRMFIVGSNMADRMLTFGQDVHIWENVNIYVHVTHVKWHCLFPQLDFPCFQIRDYANIDVKMT